MTEGRTIGKDNLQSEGKDNPQSDFPGGDLMHEQVDDESILYAWMKEQVDRVYTWMMSMETRNVDRDGYGQG